MFEKLKAVIVLTSATLAVMIPTSVQAQEELEAGFHGALRGCEEWLLNPTSWAQGPEPFIEAVGLGNQIGLVSSVDAAALPPEHLQVANHYWRINSTEDSGYILVVSDRMPFCHITGGGAADLQPPVEAVLSTDSFRSRWEHLDRRERDDMVTDQYVSREEPALSIFISRGNSAGLRTDRVQVIATAIFDLGE